MKETHPYNISDFAKEFDVTTRTLRFYESEGLLSPKRIGQKRLYSDKDRVKLKLIIRGKRLGLTLAESKELIGMYDPSGDNLKQLEKLIDKIHERRRILDQQLEDIKVMQMELDEVESRCLQAMKEFKKQN
jgi:DNA-binding transcriptional MerR regulator